MTGSFINPAKPGPRATALKPGEFPANRILPTVICVLQTVLLATVLAGLSACGQTYVDSQLSWPPPAPTAPQSPIPVKPPAMDTDVGRTSDKPSPEATASLHLRQQAVHMIDTGRLEKAIRVLERAINIAPSDGRNYYYLAEAWRLKGNTVQALEFNRLAGLYLVDSGIWQKRVKQQHRSILSRQ